jgi:hypothetical protein
LADDVKKGRRVIEIKYWVSNPFNAVEDELISHVHNKQPIEGFSFPLLDTPAIVACFLADHGSIVWQAGLTIVASKQDGLGKPVKVLHLLVGKDLYECPP